MNIIFFHQILNMTNINPKSYITNLTFKSILCVCVCVFENKTQFFSQRIEDT